MIYGTNNYKKSRKTFKVEIKKSGFVNRIKSIFKPGYKQIKAVDGIKLEINAGEKIDFLGPNGAGKSTTIKMLTCILTKTSGELSILGLDPKKR